jgi:flap endonuclease-1
VDLKWKPCQAEALTTFLVNDCGFNVDRVASNIAKLQEAHKANSKPQTRMDSFFTVKANPNAAANAKRKAEKMAAEKKAATKKKKTTRRGK